MRLAEPPDLLGYLDPPRALRGGADVASASLWPLSVDGLLLLATVTLLRGEPTTGGRARRFIWAAVILGVAVSLAANIAAAPRFGWQPVLVAGWPPVTLLLAVELLTHQSARPVNVERSPSDLDDQTNSDLDEVITRAEIISEEQAQCPTADQVMWAHYQREHASG